MRCFNSSIIRCLEYCSLVWSSVADPILNVTMRMSKFAYFLFLILLLVCNTTVALACVCFTRFFIILCIFPILNFLSVLPQESLERFLIVNSLSFSPMRLNISDYFICFTPATTKLCSDLPSMIVEAAELQKIKFGANAFILEMDGP